MGFVAWRHPLTKMSETTKSFDLFAKPPLAAVLSR
jgi:hypothetical protein